MTTCKASSRWLARPLHPCVRVRRGCGGRETHLLFGAFVGPGGTTSPGPGGRMGGGPPGTISIGGPASFFRSGVDGPQPTGISATPQTIQPHIGFHMTAPYPRASARTGQDGWPTGSRTSTGVSSAAARCRFGFWSQPFVQRPKHPKRCRASALQMSPTAARRDGKSVRKK